MFRHAKYSLSYYKKIEKRGFRVVINDKEIIDGNLSLLVI